MQLPPVKKEVNINTIISTVGFIIMIGGMIWNAAAFKTSVDEMRAKYDNWIVTHEQLHKDRLAVVSATEARFETRIAAIESNMRKIDNIEYRMTVQEQGSANLARSVEELKTSVNSLGGDIRVMREILQRLDPRSPLPAPP